MPNLSMTLKDNLQTVKRPVVLDVVRQLMKVTKITEEAEIYFPGDLRRMQTLGSSIGSDPNKLIKTESKRTLTIEVQEDFDIDSLGATSVSRVEHTPVFLDQKLMVYIAPVYVQQNVIVTLKYRTHSKTEAERWMKDMRINISNMRDVNLHDVNYSFQIPEEFWNLIVEIHKLREETAGYGEDLATYVTEHSTSLLKFVAGEAGKDPRIAIAENQERIQGFYDFIGVPDKPTRDEESGTWEISFNYKFTYDEPVACNMRYPIIVHNQLLPEEWTDPGRLDNTQGLNSRRNASFKAWKSFESDTLLLKAREQYPYVRYPEYDDFYVESGQSATGTIFLGLTSLDPNEKRTLLNLGELGDYNIDPDILAFIRDSELPYLTKPYASVFSVSLYRNQKMAQHDLITVTPDLDVVANEDLDLRDQHRIRIGIVSDLSMMETPVFDRMRNYPKAFVKIIAAIDRVLANQPDFFTIGSRQMVDKLTFDRVYQVLKGAGHYHRFPKTPDRLPSNRVPLSVWSEQIQRSYRWNQQQHAGRQDKSSRGIYNPNTYKGAFDDIDPIFLNSHRNLSGKMRTVQTSWIISKQQKDM